MRITYAFLAVLLLLSCKDKTSFESKDEAKSIGAFLESFEEISKEELKNIDLDTIQSKTKIDSIDVANFLSNDPINLSFYSNGPFGNYYSRLFKVKGFFNNYIIFYVISENFHVFKLMAANVDLQKDRVTSKLLISEFDPMQRQVYNTKINDFNFEILRTFYLNNSDRLPNEDSIIVKKIIENYKINRSGIFEIISSKKIN